MMHAQLQFPAEPVTPVATPLQLIVTSVQSSTHVPPGPGVKPGLHWLQFAPVKPYAQSSHRAPPKPGRHVQTQKGLTPDTLAVRVALHDTLLIVHVSTQKG